jgi:hypothetical protein
MAGLLHRELGLPADAAVVELALADLEQAHLLQESAGPGAAGPHHSRRDLVRRTGAVGSAFLLAPLITSVLAVHEEPLAA